jgi:SAM-dependent methyltransferase
VLSLGTTPLANSLVDAPSSTLEPRFPLDLVFCQSCTLVQITETVPPEQLFSNYVYFSSFSETMLSHARELVARLVGARRLTQDSLAVEIASNDGYLLQYYNAAGVPVLGIEPAANVARVAIEKGVPTLAEFFGLTLARRLSAEGRHADVLHANNVLAHVADLNGFVEGVREILKPDGLAAFEFPYVGDMIDNCEFDTIYHEHLCYYSARALKHLFERHGLKIVAIERIPIHGGSLLLQAARAESAQQPESSVARVLDEERARGLDTVDFYLGFARRVNAIKERLLELLHRLKREGSHVAAYGAAAKASTLLNVFGIGTETIDFVADRSVYKQGRYMPGVHIPIVAPEQLVERLPDYTLLLTWNFADEILRQQHEYRTRGGKFILPIPDVRIV